jgi:hypothetical protein
VIIALIGVWANTSAASTGHQPLLPQYVSATSSTARARREGRKPRLEDHHATCGKKTGVNAYAILVRRRIPAV